MREQRAKQPRVSSVEMGLEMRGTCKRVTRQEIKHKVVGCLFTPWIQTALGDAAGKA